MLTSIVLALTLTLTPPPPPMPSLSGSTRSATLLAQETTQLERRVKSAQHLLPVWVPLAAGVGGGAACFGLGYAIMSALPTMAYGLGAYGAAFGGVILLMAAPLVAVVGIVVAIVFAVKNGGRVERLHALESELEVKKADLARAREQESAALTPSAQPMTLLTF